MKPLRARMVAGSMLALLVVAAVQILGPTSAQATTMNEYSLGTGNGYFSIAGDATTGDVYFGGLQSPGVDAVGRITPEGAVTWFPTGYGSGLFPGNGMAMHGADVWFGVVNSSWIGFLHFNSDGSTTAGHILVNTGVSDLWTPDPAGDTIYFTDGQNLGKLEFAGPGDTAPAVSQCTLLGLTNSTVDLTGDAGGDLFFTDIGSHIDKASNAIPDGQPCEGVSSVATPTANAAPGGIALGPDGRIWFAESRNAAVGAVSTSLTGIVEYPTGGNPTDVASGPGGDVYVTDETLSRVLQVHPDGTFDSFSTVTTNASPSVITEGPDEALWFPEVRAHAIGQLVVTQPTKTTLKSQVNPATFGEKGDIIATVKSVPPGTIPTGDVQFYVNGSLFETDTLDGNGKAKMPVADLEAGSYSIVANYLGDTAFEASASKTLSQAVDPADTSVDLASSMNPAPHGSAGAITATVNPVPPGDGTPTGTITFKIDGVSQPPVALTNGKAKLKLKKLTVGSHVIVAVYSGSLDFNSSTSPPFTQVIT